MTEGEIRSNKEKCNELQLMIETVLKGNPHYRRVGQSDSPATWCHPDLSEPVTEG